uniref:DUF4958 family protein n=1 Tax=Prevotella sp. GTC17259 TaxID=3236795 RepID=A0AB33JB58_9BACT
MKQKIKCMTGKFLHALMVLMAGIMIVSCSEETTDSGKFQLYYSDVTDIGPSMSMTLYAPTYIGAKPYDFEITRVSLDGENVQNESFGIDKETGAIIIANTNQLAIGSYALSVACTSDGKHYSFDDIVHINMMRTVPEGIVATPKKLDVKYEDVLSKSEADLPTSAITTDGNHIHITKYVVANVRHEGELVDNDELFTVSDAGVVSFGKKHQNLKPGKYVIDMKLTTAVVDAESSEGLFANAVEVNVVSKPLSLVYEPDFSKVELGTDEPTKTVVPKMVGSRDGLKYSVKSIVPANAPVTIDATTGELTLAKNNLALGTECKVTVTATNAYGSTDFNEVYTFTIVPLIHAITQFAYEPTVEMVEGTALVQKVKAVTGDEVKYAFKDLPSVLTGKLNINPQTGEVGAVKGNDIPQGNYNIQVVAENPKGSMTATFVLKVIKNKYLFTYVHWGNNVGLSPVRGYASQYRIKSSGPLVMKVQSSDIQSGVEAVYSIDTKNSSTSDATIDSRTGEITFNKWQAGKVFMVLVVTTTGKGTSAEVTVKTPVFVHCSAAVKGITVDYTPFVLQVNPRTGGISNAPTVSGGTSGKFLMDYRRSFNYYNIGGPASHVTGVLKGGDTSTFMYEMWKNYYGSAAVNAGARKPVSYYDNTSALNTTLCYVDATKDCAVRVNAGKWIFDQEYANGVFIGQMTYTNDGNANKVASGSQIFPLAIWFDTSFK